MVALAQLRRDLVRLLLEVDPLERRPGRVTAPREEDALEPILQRPLRRPGRLRRCRRCRGRRRLASQVDHITSLGERNSTVTIGMLPLLDGARLSPEFPAGRRRRRPLRLHRRVHRSRHGDRLGRRQRSHTVSSSVRWSASRSVSRPRFCGIRTSDGESLDTAAAPARLDAARGRRHRRRLPGAAGFPAAGLAHQGWALGAFLWAASQAFGLLLHRLHSRTDNLAAAGVAAFGMMFRAIAVMVVVFAAAVSDPWLGVAAALVYALGFTAELGLSLVAYYTGPPWAGWPSEALRPRARDARAGHACERIRARRVRSLQGVRAARMDPDPSRPDRPLGHEGRRLPLARRRADDPARPRADARQDAQRAAGRRGDRSTRSRRHRSQSRACRRRRSAAGSRTSRR